MLNELSSRKCKGTIQYLLQLCHVQAKSKKACHALIPSIRETAHLHRCSLNSSVLHTLVLSTTANQTTSGHEIQYELRLKKSKSKISS